MFVSHFKTGYLSHLVILKRFWRFKMVCALRLWFRTGSFWHVFGVLTYFWVLFRIKQNKTSFDPLNGEIATHLNPYNDEQCDNPSSLLCFLRGFEKNTGGEMINIARNEYYLLRTHMTKHLRIYFLLGKSMGQRVMKRLLHRAWSQGWMQCFG